jgi:hypothetical protein
MPENLWPEDFGEVAQKTPVSILREQGYALGGRTANIVVGLVNSHANGPDSFRHDFSLYSAPLAYRSRFLSIAHGIDLYPVSLELVGEGNLPPVATPDEFAIVLKEVFAREKTKKIIASLIAQSKE